MNLKIQMNKQHMNMNIYTLIYEHEYINMSIRL